MRLLSVAIIEFEFYRKSNILPCHDFNQCYLFIYAMMPYLIYTGLFVFRKDDIAITSNFQYHAIRITQAGSRYQDHASRMARNNLLFYVVIC